MSDKPILIFSDRAVQHIFSIMKKENQGAYFRLSLKKMGCTGYTYVPEIVTDPKEGDIAIVAQRGLKVLVDNESMGKMRGTYLDYQEKGIIKQLMYDNPNVDSECGCGESFNLKDE